MMKAVRKCSFGSFCSLQHCSWKAGGWEIHADFSQCYSMKTGYYSLLSYLGSLPRTKGECLCSWQGTNDLPADAGSVLWMFWSPRCKAWIKYSFCLFYRKTHVFLSHFLIYIFVIFDIQYHSDSFVVFSCCHSLCAQGTSFFKKLLWKAYKDSSFLTQWLFTLSSGKEILSHVRISCQFQQTHGTLFPHGSLLSGTWVAFQGEAWLYLVCSKTIWVGGSGSLWDLGKQNHLTLPGCFF